MPHYIAPTAAPVRDKITSAQSHAVTIKKVVAELPKEVPGLLVSRLNSEVDALTDELLNAQTALTTLEKQASDQTEQLNAASDRLNAALAAKQKAEAQAAEDRRHVHRLKNYICGAGALIAFLVAFQFRAILLMLGPYGLIGLVALPAIVYAALWKFL